MTDSSDALDYLVILDFEATCDDVSPPRPQEIIEFPSVLLSVASCAVVDEFSSFVRPIHHPILTPFCRELTGIEQSDVDSAPPFPAVLTRYLEWLRSHGFMVDREDGEGPRYALMTCGDWDLGAMLPRQCAATIPPTPLLPAPFRRWINIKVPFATTLGTRKKPGMVGMLKRLDLPLLGRHHRGIDDCRNLARIATTLLERGATMATTGVVDAARHPVLALTVQTRTGRTNITSPRTLKQLRHEVEGRLAGRVRRFHFEGRELSSDEDLFDIPSGSVVGAE